MRVLAINCGSSTLKFRLSETPLRSSGQDEPLAWGIVDGVGGRGAVDFGAANGDVMREPTEVADHDGAVGRVLGWLGEVGFVGPGGFEAVGHRVVNGGDRFAGPTLVDDKVLAAIEELEELAPLHNASSLAAIRASQEVLGPGVPTVATFDTSFHRWMPEKAYRYAMTPELADKHGAHRYGFHGLAHRYMAERYAAIAGHQDLKLVTLQLGNGCSATAVNGGRSVDTSMGLTPLEGLMMGTRSGDVDPSLPVYLARREGVEVGEVLSWLNRQSGLLGVSGVSRDMRELLDAREKGNGRAALAIEMFCYRVRKQVGAYLAALGGADAVIFAGGIGEHAPEVRAEVCAGMEWCGLVLDAGRNAEAVGKEARISADGSSMRAYVIPVDEVSIIARDTVDCLRHDVRGDPYQSARETDPAADP